MRTPETLEHAFEADFEALIGAFAAQEGLLPSAAELTSKRHVARAIVPHVEKLSRLFNREADSAKGAAKGDAGLAAYWKSSSNPMHLRAAYFLYFMPANLYRAAAVWAELSRLGYRWPEGRPLRALELGAGPASAACGIAAGERYAPTGLPREGNWALIEQDKAMLELGSRWLEHYAREGAGKDWGTRPFHRKLAPGDGLLPRAAPRFNLWVSSFFLNELSETPEAQAEALMRAWQDHLDDEGVVILIEPALRLQSRKLLELRRALLSSRMRGTPMQVLLPCLGHQACGALADPEDWCHEEVSWWRAPYVRRIDEMAGLDRKTLPFSYLVLARSSRPLAELLPGLAGAPGEKTYRLVSPAHFEGREQEFFLCGQSGKCRARYRARDDADPAASLGRGDILVGAEVRGDANCARVERIVKPI